jgi:hypothetical protein
MTQPLDEWGEGGISEFPALKLGPDTAMGLLSAKEMKIRTES